MRYRNPGNEAVGSFLGFSVFIQLEFQAASLDNVNMNALGCGFSFQIKREIRNQNEIKGSIRKKEKKNGKTPKKKINQGDRSLPV